MTDPPGEWSDDQKDALRRWLDKPPSERHPHDLLPEGRISSEKSGNGKNAVSPDECAQMRQIFKAEDITIKEMARSRFDYSRTTIAEHVFARRCSHEIDETPAESPMESIDPDEFVTADECAKMRESYHDGKGIPEVQNDFDLSYGQTYHHLSGRCKCDHGVRDIRDNPVDN